MHLFYLYQGVGSTKKNAKAAAATKALNIIFGIEPDPENGELIKYVYNLCLYIKVRSLYTCNVFKYELSSSMA